MGYWNLEAILLSDIKTDIHLGSIREGLILFISPTWQFHKTAYNYSGSELSLYGKKLTEDEDFLGVICIKNVKVCSGEVKYVNYYFVPVNASAGLRGGRGGNYSKFCMMFAFEGEAK